MRSESSRVVIRSWPILPALLALLAGCGGKGGGGGGGTAPDVNAPVISNLAGSVSEQGCSLPGGPGRIETLTFSYVDADGDLRGGTFENTTTPPGGAPMVFTGGLPSPGATITGTTSGQITIVACLRFGPFPSVEEKMRVTDSAGRTSSQLTVTVGRPAGAPLHPRGSKPEAEFDKAPGR
jgi:hypothetical protein